MTTDPIADLLTRIRNAQKAGHSKVNIPSSKMKKKVLDVLKKQGFVASWKASNNEKGFENINVVLKYSDTGSAVIKKIERISKPGKRVYMSSEELSKRQDIITLRIVSTSKGIMSGQEAAQNKVGGEVVCQLS